MLNFRLTHLQETSSSNTYLKKMVSTGDCAEGTVIMADYQTNGRGQGENQWFSDRKTNLLTSILLKPECETEQFFFITVTASLAIADMLNECGIQAQIKWPNDIYAAENKIAGLLIENSLLGSTITKSMIGIGLNVNQLEFPEWIPNPTSMAKELKTKFDCDEILHRLLSKIELRYAQLRQEKFTQLLREYNHKLYKKGELCTYSASAGNFQGKIKEAGAKGELLVIHETGEQESYLFGELKMVR